jgi:thioredoxin-related protein/outer membrane protein assembly factor BamD (BamD/ComL family)
MHNPSHWSRRYLLFVAGWFCLGVSAAAPHVGAQEVEWRTDYRKARQEAAEKNRPLVLDVGTEECYWCKQLDQRTFREPAVAALLNERFIPLRVNAQVTPELAQAMRIQSYPTIVFANSEGKILGYQEGFVEAPRMKELLQRAVTLVATPEWMTGDYDEAAKAVAGNDYARAVSLLKNIVEDGKDRPVQSKARTLLQDLEQQAATRYARAKQLAERNQTKEAVDALNAVTKLYPGTAAARDSLALLNQLSGKGDATDQSRARRARDLLAQAREDYRMQQFSCCLDRCELLVNQFANTPEAQDATQLQNEIKDNPEFLKSACTQLGDRLALMMLALAESLLKKGQPQEAIYYFEKVIQNYPDTRHAEAAQSRLAAVRGLPARTDFKK